MGIGDWGLGIGDWGLAFACRWLVAIAAALLSARLLRQDRGKREVSTQ